MVKVPAYLHKRFKIDCAEKSITMQERLNNMIIAEIDPDAR